jgi:hypothetical protein
MALLTTPSPHPRPTTGPSTTLEDVKTQKERAEEKRREKLEHIREQVERGELTIRKMTPEERAEQPPRPRQPKRGRR